MINLNNLCQFEGRTTQNQKYSQINGQNGPIDKVNFSISVPRVLTAQQRQDQNVKKTDFVNFTMIGNQVKVLQQYFPPGTPIKVIAHYTEYETIDNATGQKKYGHIFEADSIGFVVSPSQNQNNNGNNNSGNNYQQPQQNYQQNNNYQQSQPQQNFMNQSQQGNQQQNGNFQMFGENEFPF